MSPKILKRRLQVQQQKRIEKMEDAVIPSRPFSLENFPVQRTETSSSTFGSMPYRICSYVEWLRALFLTKFETVLFSAAPCKEIFPPSKGHFISFSGGSAYSDNFPAQCTEISLPRWGFLSLRDQSSYLDKRRQNSPANSTICYIAT